MVFLLPWLVLVVVFTVGFCSVGFFSVGFCCSFGFCSVVLLLSDLIDCERVDVIEIFDFELFGVLKLA